MKYELYLILCVMILKGFCVSISYFWDLAFVWLTNVIFPIPSTYIFVNFQHRKGEKKMDLLDDRYIAIIITRKGALGTCQNKCKKKQT